MRSRRAWALKAKVGLVAANSRNSEDWAGLLAALKGWLSLRLILPSYFSPWLAVSITSASPLVHGRVLLLDRSPDSSSRIL